jgi:hypothetical protein
MYVYIGSNISTVVYNIDRQTVGLNNSIYSLQFNTTFPNTIVTGTYNLYVSDQDPTGNVSPVINQLISTYHIAPQITINTLTSTPSPIQTYSNAVFNGRLNNWISTLYPSTLNLFYTTLFSGVINTISTTINSDGTFTYTRLATDNITLPGVTLSLGDAVNLGASYLRTVVTTFNAVAGPTTPVLLSNPYALFDVSTIFNIRFTTWNSSYPSNMFVYLGSNISTLVYNIGSKSVTLNNSVYSLNFNAIIPDTFASGSYKEFFIIKFRIT